MTEYWISSDKKPTFEEWLDLRHNTSPSQFYHMAKMTASYKDYQKWMAILRHDYREEMILRRDLIENNPFAQDKEENENGYVL